MMHGGLLALFTAVSHQGAMNEQHQNQSHSQNTKNIKPTPTDEIQVLKEELATKKNFFLKDST